MKILDISKSNEFKERARKVIPHQTGTFSRAASSFIEGVYPSYIQSANGSHFTDVDGNIFLDYLLITRQLMMQLFLKFKKEFFFLCLIQ